MAAGKPGTVLGRFGDLPDRDLRTTRSGGRPDHQDDEDGADDQDDEDDEDDHDNHDDHHHDDDHDDDKGDDDDHVDDDDDHDDRDDRDDRDDDDDRRREDSIFSHEFLGSVAQCLVSGFFENLASLADSRWLALDCVRHDPRLDF